MKGVRETMTIETTGDLNAAAEVTGVIPAKTKLGGGPMVEKWDELGPAITDLLRKLPPEHRYRGKLVRELFTTGIFTRAEITGDKVAISAITEKLGIMERQGLVKKTGKFAVGNQLWVAIGDVKVDLELCHALAVELSVASEDGRFGVLAMPWAPRGVLEERGHKYMIVAAGVPLPRTTTGGVQGAESVTVKVKYDPRWPHEGIKFSYDEPLRSEIRRKWRKDFEKKVYEVLTTFGPAPLPKIEEEPEPVQAQEGAIEASVAHEERTLERLGSGRDIAQSQNDLDAASAHEGEGSTEQ